LSLRCGHGHHSACPCATRTCRMRGLRGMSGPAAGPAQLVQNAACSPARDAAELSAEAPAVWQAFSDSRASGRARLGAVRAHCIRYLQMVGAGAPEPATAGVRVVAGCCTFGRS